MLTGFFSRLSIRSRLFLIIAIVLLISLAFAAWHLRDMYLGMKADIEARNTALASSLAKDLEGSIKGTPDVSDAASRFPLLRERFIQHERGEQTCVVIVNAEGKIIFCTLHNDMTGADLERLPNLRARFSDAAGSVEDMGIDGIRRLYSFASLSSAAGR